jgi:hypothetical protein
VIQLKVPVSGHLPTYFSNCPIEISLIILECPEEIVIQLAIGSKYSEVFDLKSLRI